MKKRLLSWLLVVVMLLGMLPMTAIAEDHAGQVRVIVENATYAKTDGAAWEGVLVDKWVSLTSTSTAITCVVDALGSYSQTGADANYITEINGLKAYDGGQQSGWMGTLNDFFTNEGLGSYSVANGRLSAGDEIHMQYTCAWGTDLGNDWSNSDRTLKTLRADKGTLSPAFDKDTHAYTLTVPAGTVRLTAEAANKRFQVRVSVDGKEYKHTAELPVANGSVITVTCGDESWDAMSASKAKVETYTITVSEKKDSADVVIRSQMMGGYLHGLKTETVSAKLAESYGYTDKVDGVSALDALVRAHELVFADAFTEETAKDFLVVSSSGYVSKLFGEATSSNGFFLNEGYPNDGTSSAYGGYNGTLVTTQEIKDGDVLDFFIYADQSYWSDYYTWIDAPVGAGAGQSFEVTVTGFYASSGYLCKTPAELKAKGKLLEGVQLAWVDPETGAVTPIPNAVTAADEDDEDNYYYATVKAPQEQGTYYLTAISNEDEEIYCLMNPVAFEVAGAPESLTVKYTGSRELNGQLVGKKGDTFQLKAYDQNGKETPVRWSTSSSWMASIDKNGLITLTSAMGFGGSSTFYYTATSLADATVKVEGKLEFTGYEISEYNRSQKVALSTDGQSVKTTSITGGVKNHTVWSYEIPEGVAALASEPGNGTEIKFNLYRPGKIRVRLALDVDAAMTSEAEITVTGVAVEDAAGKQGKTYLERSGEQPNPTAQLTAYCEEGRSAASWASSNTDVVTVDETGRITAQAIGSALITVTDDQGTKGGIKVVVTDADTPYFESLEFLTTALSNWKTGQTFQPTTLEYDLTIRTYSASTLTMQATTLYNTEKYTATAEYTDGNGEKQTVSVNSGKSTALPNQPFDESDLTVTLADKNDPAKKTVYTFHVTRPRDTTKAIMKTYGTSTGLALVPDGRELESSKYENYAEGTVFRLAEDGSYVTSGSNRTTGTDANHPSYRVFLFENEKSFSLNFTASTAYQHLRYSADGETWTELPQGGGSTGKLGFAWGKATIKLQILDDKTYSANVKAGKDGFAEGETKEYTVEVVQLDISAADAQLLTAETGMGDWYPAFSPAQYSYNIVVPNGTKEAVLTYTVTEGASVKLGSKEQTPNESGVYTLTLKTSAQTLTLTAGNGMTNTYSIKLLERSKYAGPDKVVDYLCIGSQYTNISYGTSPENTLKGTLASLGNFGGYITYYFENPITDNPNNKYGIDFYVYGNSSESNQASMAELGQVYVSEDGKTWFALAGSEHYEDKAIWDYTITYKKDAAGKSVWTDNQGNTMIDAAKVAWPKRSVYYMNDVWSRDSYTFTGVLFKSQEDGTVMGTSNTSSFAASARFGYADYYANGTFGADVNPYVENPTQSNGFDLAWAVDANGSPVKLTDVHYVRVATASNIWAGAFKEKSTEVMQLVLTTAQENPVGKTEQPLGVTLANGSYEKNVELTGQVCHVSADGMSELALTVNGTAQEDNIYINNTRVASGKSVTLSIPETGERLVRVIVQNGEKEPTIYLLKIERGQTQEEKTIASIRDIYEQTGATLNAAAQASAPQVGSVGGEWLVLGLARSGYETSDEYYQNVVKYVEEHINEKGQLSTRVSTDNSRLILALTAAGYDVTDVGGHDLLQGLSDLSYIKKQGINGPIFALLALDCHDYDVPKNADAAKQTTREALIDYILGAQLENGGWSFDETADADLTAMALQALAPYQSDARVAAATQKAVELLSSMQEENGGFASWGSNNSNTAAQVIIALSALNIDAFRDERFVKNGTSALEAMYGFYTGKGSFGYAGAQTSDQMSTEQCYLALAAYFRMLDRKTALYNMTDVELGGHVHGFLPAFDENGHWTVCSCGEKTESKPHTYGEWNVTKRATDKEAGARERTCTVCGYVQHEEIPVNPKTGDTMQLPVWIALGGASMLALAVLLLLKKRQNA